MSNPPSAEEYKELGNKAFTDQNYNEAIELYTKAIKVDCKNHVYFSNRSASYAGIKQWDNAIQDAKECIKLNPSFVKGYYRLATAQIESHQLDAATSTIKQGLNVEPDNSQLNKLMRTVKSRKAVAAAHSSSTSGTTNTLSPSSSYLPSNSSELVDLQNQLRATVRDYNIVNANIGKSQKEMRMNELTVTELQKLSTSPQNDNENIKMYKGIGKMFMLSNRQEVFQSLEQENKDNEKKVADLMEKKEYLEKRLKSQQQNIVELTKNPTAE